MGEYDDYDWDELPADIQAAATTLGYTKELWDSDKDSEISKEYDWDDLDADQQKAAATMGYDKASWDSS